MPTNKRKGRRGKQRKDDDVPRNRDKKRAESVAGPSKREIAEIVRESMVQGCRVVRTDGGGIQVRHPVTMFGENERLTNRELWNEEEKGVVVDNYIHHFAQEIRDGNFEGTKVIGGNLLCPHLGSKLIEALFKEDIHIAILDFLSKCDGRLSVALKDTVGKRVSLPSMWIEILTLMIGNEECSRETLVMVAKRLEPLVICMIHERRQLFRSNDTWHISLGAFFSLMFYLMYQSEEIRWIMLSYDGLLSFVAQASCWDVSRGDIAKEAVRIRCSDDYVPRSFSTACREARKVICLVVEEHDIEEGEDADAPFSPLELIACTPLSNDPECKDSAMVGFVRSMRCDKDNLPSMLSVIIETLVLTRDYVDKRVIAELIDYGMSSECVERAEFMFIMRLLLGILGAYGGIRPSDSRCAAAISCDFLQFCNHVCNLASDKEWELNFSLTPLFEALAVMSMHSKTSRVLASCKRAQFHLALETLDERHGLDLPVLDHFDDVGTSTCCNCLKKCEKKTLRLCNGCKIEQYCTLTCQEESWNAGHSRLCKELANFSDCLRHQEVLEADIKRLTTLNRNLMLSGCSFVQRNLEAILKLSSGDGELAKLLIDFGKVPQRFELQLRHTRNDREVCPASLYFEFVSPVWYDFAARLGLDHVRLEKCIPIAVLERVQVEQNERFEESYYDSEVESEVEAEKKEEEEEVKINKIIAARSMTLAEWEKVCFKMNTSEVTYGSRWIQEETDRDPETYEERFLVKWEGLSFLHCSWETEKDLIDCCEGAKTRLSTFFRKAQKNGLLYDVDERLDGVSIWYIKSHTVLYI